MRYADIRRSKFKPTANVRLCLVRLSKRSYENLRFLVVTHLCKLVMWIIFCSALDRVMKIIYRVSVLQHSQNCDEYVTVFTPLVVRARWSKQLPYYQLIPFFIMVEMTVYYVAIYPIDIRRCPIREIVLQQGQTFCFFFCFCFLKLFLCIN